VADLAYFPFYPERWLADPKVRHLTLEERGAYHELMAGMWTYESGTCALPNDDRFLARFLGVSVRKWQALRRALIDGPSSPIHTSEDGNWLYSPFLREQHEKALRKSASSAASASRRWSVGNANAMPSHSDRIATAMPTQSEGNATQEPEVESRRKKDLVTPSSANADSELPGPPSARRASAAVPESNREIVGGLLEHLERALGRKPTGEERGIVAHAYAEYGIAPVTAAIGELAAMCDRGQPPREPGPYLVAVLQRLQGRRPRDYPGGAPRTRLRPRLPSVYDLGYMPDPPPG